MHPVEEKMALWRRRRPRCTTARDSANSEGGIEKYCKPPSGGLGGKIALKIWQFGHFKKYENCISDVFSSVVNSLPEYWKPDISHPNWLSRLKKQKQRIKIYTAWKASKYGVILVRLFLYSDWIRRFEYYPRLLTEVKQTRQTWQEYMRQSVRIAIHHTDRKHLETNLTSLKWQRKHLTKKWHFHH